MNQLTSYLDMSFVYGSDVCEANTLRTHYGGRMNITRVPSKPLLPQTASNPECRAPSGICFNAGIHNLYDIRCRLSFTVRIQP